MPGDQRIGLWFGILALIILSIGSWLPDRRPQAEAQEVKRYFYKVVDVAPDNAAMQETLDEYGAAGWELVVVGMGNMTTPRLIFRK